jgi:hypothetical protein
MDVTDSTGEPLVVVWNNYDDQRVTHQFSMARLQHFYRYKERFPSYNQTAPRFQAYRPKQDFGEGNPWVLQVSYNGLGTVKVTGK